MKTVRIRYVSVTVETEKYRSFRMRRRYYPAAYMMLQIRDIGSNVSVTPFLSLDLYTVRTVDTTVRPLRISLPRRNHKAPSGTGRIQRTVQAGGAPYRLRDQARFRRQIADSSVSRSRGNNAAPGVCYTLTAAAAAAANPFSSTANHTSGRFTTVAVIIPRRRLIFTATATTAQ